jgi:hypothetical protein
MLDYRGVANGLSVATRLQREPAHGFEAWVLCVAEVGRAG